MKHHKRELIAEHERHIAELIRLSSEAVAMAVKKSFRI
jgi:hypothetical protein